MKLKCLVVDDEPLGRKLIEENIDQIPFLEMVGKCKNAFEAMDFLQNHEVDLMFLDIQMPGMLGTQFLNGLKYRPMVILVTAYSQYALEGYELDVIDYIMKPVSVERFAKAAHKALERAQNSSGSGNTAAAPVTKDESSFFVNVEYSLVKVPVNEVTHVEGMKDYVKIYLSTADKPIITKSTLKGIFEKLPANEFMRVHKSYIANIGQIKSIRNHVLTIGKHQIPVSESNMAELMKRINYES